MRRLSCRASHTHTLVGFRLPSYNYTAMFFADTLEVQFNETLSHLLAVNPYCDSWINFQFNPGDFAMPHCPISLCEQDIRRVTAFLRPSVLLTDKPWETLAFAFWFAFEQCVFLVVEYCANLVSCFEGIAFEFVMNNAGTIYLVHSFIPWRFISNMFRSLQRFSRPTGHYNYV